jgi:hypothetical protein
MFSCTLQKSETKVEASIRANEPQGPSEHCGLKPDIFLAIFLFGLLFDPEDIGNIFLGNIG